MHGTVDPIVPFDSGELEGNVQYWIRRNGCTLTPVVTRMPDVDPNDGARTRVESYGNCKDGADVALYAIEGGGHHWPGGANLIYLSENIQQVTRLAAHPSSRHLESPPMSSTLVHH